MKRAALVCAACGARASALPAAAAVATTRTRNRRQPNPQAKAACDGSRSDGGAEPAGELPDGREHDPDEAVQAGADRRRRGLLEGRPQGSARRVREGVQGRRLQGPVRGARGPTTPRSPGRARAAPARSRSGTTAAAARSTCTSRTARPEQTSEPRFPCRGIAARVVFADLTATNGGAARHSFSEVTLP